MRYEYIVFGVIITLCVSCNTPKPTVENYPNFEGIIRYENSLISNETTERDINYFNLFGNIEIESFSQGNFLNEFPNGQEYIKTLYNNQSNTYFMFYRSGEVKYFTCDSDSDKIVSITKKKEMINICGYECYPITLDFGRFSMTYYYTKQLPIDPNVFKNYKYRHFNVLYKETKSMYLKSIMHYKDLQFVSTATEVTRKDLPETIFEEPIDATKF